MKLSLTGACLASMLALLTVPVAAQQLPTVDEALEISQKTGRPIFAMAGNEK